MFGRNWPSGSGEKILKYFQYNFTISLLSPLGEGRGSLDEIGSVVLEKLKM